MIKDEEDDREDSPRAKSMPSPQASPTAACLLCLGLFGGRPSNEGSPVPPASGIELSGSATTGDEVVRESDPGMPTKE
ncbi:hypothetical protein HDU67_000796, partial [Dinochytrium kinnereticum]